MHFLLFYQMQAGKVPFCKFHLGDRPIPVTFKRAIAALSLWQKSRLAWGLCFLSDPIRYKSTPLCPYMHIYYCLMFLKSLLESKTSYVALKMRPENTETWRPKMQICRGTQKVEQNWLLWARNNKHMIWNKSHTLTYSIYKSSKGTDLVI